MAKKRNDFAGYSEEFEDWNETNSMGILQIIFIIIAPIFVFRTARENGYNPVFWTLASIVSYFGIQLLLGAIVGVAISLGIFSVESIEGLSFFLGIFGMVAGVASVLMILRHVNQLRDDDDDITEPPPPSEFKIT